MSPTVLAYLMGPVALVVILALMKFHVVAHESVWLWMAVFAGTPIASAVANYLYTRRPTVPRLHLRVAASAAAVTVVIYLSG
jgi:hypothetical protein